MITESIFSNVDVVIPMADVQHVEKHYYSYTLTGVHKKGDFSGIQIITKHTTWDNDRATWANPIWISQFDKEAENFLKVWCQYRRELEGLDEQEVK